MTITTRESSIRPETSRSTPESAAQVQVAATSSPTQERRSTTASSSPPQSLPPSLSEQKPEPSKKRRRRASHHWTKKCKPKTARKPFIPPTHYTCRICSEELHVADFPKYLPPRLCLSRIPQATDVPLECVPHLTRSPHSNCKREPVCKTCIGSNMAAIHELVGARRVITGCFEPDCEAIWPTEFILDFFPKDERFHEYANDMMDAYVHDTPLATCTNPGCGACGFVDAKSPGYPQVECMRSVCKTRFCASCNVPWHKGITCIEYAAQNVNAIMSDTEKETLALMQSKDGRRCPNCYLVIEKDGGCNSMLCLACGKFFDWETAASAVPGSRKPAMPATSNFDAYNRRIVFCEADV